MNTTIKTAIILAAGRGQRLKSILDDKPKGFIQFANKPIIEESIEKLQQAGIEQIYIITGYLSEFYDNLLPKHNGLKTIKNEQFNNSGSLYSLYCARDMVNENFILLESDLLYEQKALTEVINCPQDDVILLSDVSENGDEVFVETDAGNNLVTMSKDKATLKNIKGEFVGISKISNASFQAIAQRCSEEFQHDLNLEYETAGLVSLAEHKNIFCHKVENLVWCEIDNSDHFENAKNIYKQLRDCK